MKFNVFETMYAYLWEFIYEILAIFGIKKDDNGKIQLIQANTALMNRKTAVLTVTLQERYKSMEPEKMEIPVGTVFGSPLVSQMEQTIQIRVLPLSVS